MNDDDNAGRDRWPLGELALEVHERQIGHHDLVIIKAEPDPGNTVQSLAALNIFACLNHNQVIYACLDHLISFPFYAHFSCLLWWLL